MNRNSMSRVVFGIVLALAVLVIPHAVRGQAPQQNGNPARITIKSNVLGEDRVVLVRTPPGYERGERYPVLYMTDGDAHLGHTITTVSFLARNGRMPEMIIVAIVNTDRTRDLTPTNASMNSGTGTLQFPTSGGADKFIKFIETELIPNIESTYRVQPYRVFAGHSLGGLFAVHALVTRPDLFNAYIAVSPSLQWDNQVELKRFSFRWATNRETSARVLLALKRSLLKINRRSSNGLQRRCRMKITVRSCCEVTIRVCERSMQIGNHVLMSKQELSKADGRELKSTTKLLHESTAIQFCRPKVLSISTDIN